MPTTVVDTGGKKNHKHVEVIKDTIRTKTTVTKHYTGLCGSVLAGVIRVVSLITACFLFVVGLSHALLSWENWCSNSICGDYSGTECQCFGPWLVWTKKEGLDFFKAVSDNDATIMSNNYNNLFSDSTHTYGTAFTLNIQTLFKTWVPLFVGTWAVMEHIEPFTMFKLTGMWNSFVFYLIVMFFIAFPCAGNFGIFTGFLCALTSGLCLVGVFVSKGEPATFGRVRFGVYDLLRCGQNKWKVERTYFTKHRHQIVQVIKSVKSDTHHHHKGETVMVDKKHHHSEPKSPRSKHQHSEPKSPRSKHHDTHSPRGSRTVVH